MCGIAGIFVYHSKASRVDREEVIKIRDHMESRGPDGKGEWYSSDGRVGLGHRRLAIIDLSDNASQPMVSNCGQVIISYNGEIYNYIELREELVKKGYKFKSNSDTEVLINLYMDKGEDMVNELRGMFAFAIWDERKQGMFLARDHFGIKPLYIADDGKTIRFASQVKALLAGGQISRELDPAGQVGFYLWGHLPDPFTLYRNIHALPAGTTLQINSEGEYVQKQYFSISEVYREAEEEKSHNIKHEKKINLRESLLGTVRNHLIADVPVGLFLSSGLDSITLMALASELKGDLKTVTLGFEEFKGTENDETILAEKIAKQYGTDHRTVWVSSKDFESERGKLLDVMDQPSIDGVNTYFVAKAASEVGLKIAISGLGGDELFGGYSSFKQIPSLVRAISPMNVVPGVGKLFRQIASPFLSKFMSPKYAGLLEYGSTFGSAYLLKRGLYMPWELPELLEENVISDGLKSLNTIPCLNRTVSGLKSKQLKVSSLEVNWYMRNQLLRDSDWAGMAHSLEIRVPMVDSHLIRHVTQLHLSDSINQGKESLADTTQMPLPKTVTDRPKTGFSIPVSRWTQQEVKTDTVQKDMTLTKNTSWARKWANQIMDSYNP